MQSLVPLNVLRALQDHATRAPSGCFVEIGVYRGGSAWQLYQVAEQQNRTLHLFDTFTGMPFAGPEDRHRPGDFAIDIDLTSMQLAMYNAKFHVGVFPGTLPLDLTEIAFAHIDCDQYRSVRDSIECLWPRLVPGGSLWFDDYADIPGCRRAVLEFFREEELTIVTEGRAVMFKSRGGATHD